MGQTVAYIRSVVTDDKNTPVTAPATAPVANPAEQLGEFSPQEIAKATAESAMENEYMGTLTTREATRAAIKESQMEADILGGMTEEEAFNAAVKKSLAGESTESTEVETDESSSEADTTLRRRIKTRDEIIAALKEPQMEADINVVMDGDATTSLLESDADN